jgi:uncharacterized iron-regulated membrane protein
MIALPQPASSKTRRQNWRRVWLNAHLYLGLSAGFIFAMVGLTGSVLVFYVELDEFLNPPLRIEMTDTQKPLQTYETLLQSLQKKHPERTGSWRMEMPRDNQSMVTARYYKPHETEHLHFAPYMVSINPYTAEIVSSRFWGDTVMTWIYDLHYTLLFDTTGKLILSIIGGFLLVILLTGIYLWFPSKTQWKNALTFKRNSSSARFVFDLHKLNGVYSLGLLLLLVLTGVLLELPDTFNPLINQLSPLYQSPEITFHNQAHKQRVVVDNAVNIALTEYPKAQLRWIETPNNLTGVYRIMLYQTGEPSKRFPKTIISIEQYSSKVLNIRNPVESSNGDLFVRVLHPLHSGEIAGLTGRWIVFFSGFIPAILYVTGFMRWRQKHLAKTKKIVRV